MHFPEDMIILEKWITEKPISAVYFDGNKDRYYVKRFLSGFSKVDQNFIPNGNKIQLEIVSSDWKPVIEISFPKKSGVQKDSITYELENLITIKGIKAQGNQLTSDKIKNINLIEPIPFTPPEKVSLTELELSEGVDIIKEGSSDTIQNSDNNGQTELKF